MSRRAEDLQGFGGKGGPQTNFSSHAAPECTQTQTTSPEKGREGVKIIRSYTLNQRFWWASVWDGSRQKLDIKRVEPVEYEILPVIQYTIQYNITQTSQSLPSLGSPAQPPEALTFFFPSNSSWFGFETCIYQAVRPPATYLELSRMDCMIPAPRATWPLPVRKAGFRAAQKRLVFFMMRRNSYDNRRQQKTASHLGLHSRTQRYRGHLRLACHLMGGKVKMLEA